MAELVLKDRDNNVGKYSGVTQLNVPYQDSEGNASKQKFTRLNSLKAYALIGADNGGYTVKASLSAIPTENYFMTEFSDAQCQELGYATSDGSYRLLLFLTTKTLTVGETYTITDMY